MYFNIFHVLIYSSIYFHTGIICTADNKLMGIVYAHHVFYLLLALISGFMTLYWCCQGTVLNTQITLNLLVSSAERNGVPDIDVCFPRIGLGESGGGYSG